MIDRYKLESFKRGSYSPSFFKMEVLTTHSLSNLTELPPEVFATFFHEYLHFLQDITTTFGLINATMQVDRMKFANQYLLNNPSPFTVPIPIDADSINAVNRGIQRVYLGSRGGIKTINIRDVNEVASNRYTCSARLGWLSNPKKAAYKHV